ncbi:MAG: hypothetical protein OEW37_03400 [Rhodospirillaceae bacterium]|nr:hypothetical protein [Rhodospirillaceae bacterium]
MNETTNENSNDTNKPGLRDAMAVTPGNVVIIKTDDNIAAFIKTERIGKEYIHHYAVQIFPRVKSDLGMVYLDPEDKIFDTGFAANFELGAGVGDEAPAPGHAFENASGHFIKVIDDPKSQKMFGFIDISTAVVRLRQERGVINVHSEWCAGCVDNGKSISLDEVLARFKNEI